MLTSVVLILSFTEFKYDNQFISLGNINILNSEDDFIDDTMILNLIEEYEDSITFMTSNQLNIKSLEKYLQKQTTIKNVEVSINQNGEVNIDVLQRKPVVRIFTESKNYYLDEDARKMPISRRYTSRLLLVNGDVEEQHHKEIFDFVQIINSSTFWKAQIVQMYFIKNEVILVPRVGEHKIYFGLLKDVNKKLDNLFHFYKYAMPLKGWDLYSEINLKYNNQIVCTKNI